MKLLAQLAGFVWMRFGQVDLLTWVADCDPKVTRIVLTGQATLESTLRAINDARVHRFLIKPGDPVQLMPMIRKALEERDERPRN